MNFVLAFVLLTGGFMAGMKPMSVMLGAEQMQAGIERGWVQTSDAGVYVASVLPNSPAERAGLQAGVFITKINGIKVSTPQQLINALQGKKNRKAWGLEIARINDKGKVIERFNKAVVTGSDNKLGVGLGEYRRYLPLHLPLPAAASVAAGEMWTMGTATIGKLGEMVGSVFAGKTLPDEVGGPVAIANITHQIIQQTTGLIVLVQFTALLSLSLGVINILPIPALDGGRLVFLLWELLTRRKPNTTLERRIHIGGLIVVLVLLLLLTVNDLEKIFG